MALSITRPDPSSPAEVSTATFSTSRRGFDSDEVREFLRTVAAELKRLQDREAQLEHELQEAKQAPTVSVAELEEAVITGLLGEEAKRIVATARESGGAIKARAEEAAARLLNEANEEAQRVRAEAEVEAGRRRQDAALSAEDELQMAKQQGRDMVNEARAYRERVLGELARRRELARKQIEQLIVNRDRLMQSFEKSRSIAVEVIAELGPQAASTDLVDLSPITGPVPVILPREIEVPKPVPEPVVAAAPEPVVVAEGVVEEVVVEEVVVEEVVAPIVEPTTPIASDTAVDHLFARLRAASETVKVKPEPKPKATKKASKEAATTEQEPAAKASQLSVFQSSPAEPEAVVDAVDSPFGRRDAQLAPLVAAASRNLKRVLADEQNDVLLLLRGREVMRSLDKVLPTAEVHIRRYADAIADEVMNAATAGAASMDDGQADKRAAVTRESALGPAIEALAVAVIGPLRDRLDRAIAAADGDNGELVGLTRTVYREWKTRRIDEHVDHVMRVAFGRGAFAVLRAGTPVCWAVDPGGPACPDAEDNALAGAVGAGDPFPTEHISAPAHEGCRCMLLLAAR
ncbi:MAG: DivIVA domain-containing protein [Ilumatobacteraceae bacterium]